MQIFVLRLCDPVQTAVRNHFDLSNLFGNLAAQFAVVVQFNSSKEIVDIDRVCSIMENNTLGSPLTRFGQVNLMIMNDLQSPCLDYKYDKMLEHMKKTSWDADAAQGGKILKLYLFIFSFSPFYTKLDNGPFKRATNLVFTKRHTVKYLAIGLHCRSLLISAQIFSGLALTQAI